MPKITSIIHGLNLLIKRQRPLDCIKKKKDPTLSCLQETHLKYKDLNRLKVKGWE